jgi:TonB-dependent starch-binding outer membrane protein SusC
MQPTARKLTAALLAAATTCLVAATFGPVRVALAQDPAPPQSTVRTITGVVKEAGSEVPLEGAVITVREREISAVTDARGRFTLTNMPTGPLVMDVFGPAHETLEITVDQSNTVEITLKPAVSTVVVTERAPVIAKQNLANGASVVRAEDLNRVSAQTVDNAIQGKLAGANVQQNSGAPGGGLQVRLRGVSTIIGQSEPLFVVDGVLVSNVAIPNGLSAVTLSTRGSSATATQDDQVSRIADLNPNDIESIEVLKGASASALYGSKAANGVVIITTKRGTAGGLRASVTQRFGSYFLSNKLGSRTFATVDEAVDVFGMAARDHYQPGRVFDLEEQLAGRNPLANETSANLAGGTKEIHYYASLLQRNDPGIMTGTGYEKQAGRVSVEAALGSRLRVGFTTNVIRSVAQRGVNNNDNATISHYMTLPGTPNFVDLARRPDGTFPQNPFVGSLNNPLQTAALASNDEKVWRIIASANAALLLYSSERQFLQLQTTVGVDSFDQQNKLFFPPELHFEPLDNFPGTALDTNGESENVNFAIGLLHRYTGDRFSNAASFGIQLEQRDLDVLYVASLGASRPNVDYGTSVGLTQLHTLIRDRGLYFQEEALVLEQRLSLLAALRAEQSSTAGDPYKIYLFPKGQVSYSIPGMPPQVELVRVRAAYGESGNQPRYAQKFTPLTGQNNVDGNPGLRLRGFLGSADLEPERQREIDLGFDVAAYDGRAVLEFSVYQKVISDLLLERLTAPSTGFIRDYINGGSLRNRGLEVMLQLIPVRRGRFEWLARTIFSMNRSKITDLPVPAFQTGGFGSSLGSFRIEKDKSATQIVGNHGLKADGTCCEVAKLGDGEPDFRITFFQGFTFGPFGASALLDWQKGSDVINLTKLLYDGAQNSKDFVPAGMDRLMRFETDAGVYVEDASYLKLREVELHVDLPQSWVTHLGPMKTARLSVAARNLFTITPYTGLDPEVSNFGNQPIARNIDVAPYPPSRSFWLSLSAGF